MTYDINLFTIKLKEKYTHTFRVNCNYVVYCLDTIFFHIIILYNPLIIYRAANNEMVKHYTLESDKFISN